MPIRYACLSLLMVATQLDIAHREVPEFSIATSADGCAVPKTVLRLARTTGISVGVETVPAECWRGVVSSPETPVLGATIGAIANRLSELDTRYKSMLLPNMVATRPTSAWGDHDYFMTRPVGPFDVTMDTIDIALGQMSRAFDGRPMRASIDLQTLRHWQEVFGDRPPGRGPDPIALLGWFGTSNGGGDARWHVNFKGGSFFEALNAMVQAPGGGGWIVTYCGDAMDETDAMVLVIVRDVAGRRERLLSLGKADTPCTG